MKSGCRAHTMGFQVSHVKYTDALNNNLSDETKPCIEIIVKHDTIQGSVKMLHTQNFQLKPECHAHRMVFQISHVKHTDALKYVSGEKKSPSEITAKYGVTQRSDGKQHTQ